jgi:hypothetical protein
MFAGTGNFIIAILFKKIINLLSIANSQLTGRKYDYDGNPHHFGSEHPRYNSGNAIEASNNASNNDHRASNILLQQLAIASQQFRVEFPSFLSHVKIKKRSAPTESGADNLVDDGSIGRINTTYGDNDPSIDSSNKRKTSVNWTSSKKLPDRFMLNTSVILKAVDAVLAATTDTRNFALDSGFM